MSGLGLAWGQDLGVGEAPCCLQGLGELHHLLLSLGPGLPLALHPLLPITLGSELGFELGLGLGKLFTEG